MKKREASITPKIEKYIELKKIFGYFEIKQTTTDTFSLSSFEPHQIAGLLAASENGIVHKISDADPRLKICDVVSIPPMASYVVIRYPKNVFFIHPAVINHLLRFGQKSLSIREARERCDYELEL